MFLHVYLTPHGDFDVFIRKGLWPGSHTSKPSHLDSRNANVDRGLIAMKPRKQTTLNPWPRHIASLYKRKCRLAYSQTDTLSYAIDEFVVRPS